MARPLKLNRSLCVDGAMGSYSGNLGQPDRTRAIAGVVAVHVLLALIIVTGLNVSTIRAAVDHMTTITIADPPPPPPPVDPPPARQPDRAKQAEGAAAKISKPTEIVAPPQKLPTPNTVVAAPVAGIGSAAKSGAALAGTGTGAGGNGTGAGGGGLGDTSRFTPARLVRNLSSGDYQSIASGRMPVGSADVTLAIAATGAVADCRLLRSTGDPLIDRGLCPLLMHRLRFHPALDDRGRPIPYRTNYRANWQLRF